MTTLFCEFGLVFFFPPPPLFFIFFLSCLVVLHFEVTEENEDVEVTEKNEVAAIERVSSPFLFTWKVIIQYVVNFEYG